MIGCCDLVGQRLYGRFTIFCWALLTQWQTGGIYEVVYTLSIACTNVLTTT